MQQPGFGLGGGSFGQQGVGSGPSRGPLPGMQQGGVAFGMPQQQQSFFGAQQTGFGVPSSFGAQQRGAAQQPASGFGGSDPFGPSTGSFGGSSDPFGAPSSLFTQGAANVSPLGKTGQGSTGGKDPFADLSAFH